MASEPDFAAILAGFAASGASQADIARRLQVDRSTVCRIFNGETRYPTYPLATRIMGLDQAKSLKSLLRTCNENGCK